MTRVVANATTRAVANATTHVADSATTLVHAVVVAVHDTTRVAVNALSPGSASALAHAGDVETRVTAVNDVIVAAPRVGVKAVEPNATGLLPMLQRQQTRRRTHSRRR